MPEAEEIIEDAPVVEDPPFALPEGFAETVQGWDVPVEMLPEAVALYKGLQTEEGVIDNFVVLGQKLGFGIKELERLFADDEPPAPAQPAPAPVATPVEPEDPERLMNAAEVRAMLEAERATYDSKFDEFQQAQVAVQQQAFQDRQTKTFAAIGNWFDSKEIKDENVQAMVAKLGEKTLDPTADSYDPQVAIAALERGLTAYEAFVDEQAEARLRKKAVIASAQPTGVGEAGGSAGGEGDETAPDYAKLALSGGAMEAAKARVRKRLMEGG